MFVIESIRENFACCRCSILELFQCQLFASRVVSARHAQADAPTSLWWRQTEPDGNHGYDNGRGGEFTGRNLFGLAYQPDFIATCPYSLDSCWLLLRALC